MASQQPRPSWFRFPFMFRAAGPAPVPVPAAPITPPPAPRAPPPPQPQPAMVRPAPPPVASPPAAPITRPTAPRTSPPQPTLVRPTPPPVASPPLAVAPAPPSPLPSVPSRQTATAPPRSPVATTTAPPRSPTAPTSDRQRSPVPPTPAPVASPPPTVAPIPPGSPALRLPAATPAPLPPPISRSPVASPTAPPPPRSPAVSPTKYPIVKTSVSMPPSPVPEESQKTSTNAPFLSSIPLAPKTPAVQKSMLHSPTPTARNASATGSPPEVVKLFERTPVQSTPIKPVSRPPSPSILSPPQTKTATDHEPKITAISNGKREPTKDKGLHKKLTESEEYQMRVITLAGQNKGATMDWSASGHQSLVKNGKMKTWRNGEKSSSVGGKSVKDKNCDETVMESPQMTAFMNSNVQGINNSICYNGSSTHNDPGIHLSLSRKKDQRLQ